MRFLVLVVSRILVALPIFCLEPPFALLLFCESWFSEHRLHREVKL